MCPAGVSELSREGACADMPLLTVCNLPGTGGLALLLAEELLAAPLLARLSPGGSGVREVRMDALVPGAGLCTPLVLQAPCSCCISSASCRSAHRVRSKLSALSAQDSATCKSVIRTCSTRHACTTGKGWRRTVSINLWAARTACHHG